MLRHAETPAVLPRHNPLWWADEYEHPLTRALGIKLQDDLQRDPEVASLTDTELAACLEWLFEDVMFEGSGAGIVHAENMRTLETLRGEDDFILAIWCAARALAHVEAITKLWNKPDALEAFKRHLLGILTSERHMGRKLADMFRFVLPYWAATEG